MSTKKHSRFRLWWVLAPVALVVGWGLLPPRSRLGAADLLPAANGQLGLTAIRSVSSSLDEIYRNALHAEGLAA